MNRKTRIFENKNILFEKVSELIELARKKSYNSVNIIMVNAYYEIGRMIIEDEQKGEERADYGKELLLDLSRALTKKFGKGFSETNLRNMRKFFLVYSGYFKGIQQKPSAELEKHYNVIESKNFNVSRDFKLSWSHYLILMRIEDTNERKFYEIEAEKQQWSEPQLRRQYNSSLYERLVLSRNKDEVLRLAKDGHAIERAKDIIKNPLTLEFLGLEEKAVYSESDLENAIIFKLQNFLLELGNGFLFEARQKRFSFLN